jgi:hypothetical protein
VFGFIVGSGRRKAPTEGHVSIVAPYDKLLLRPKRNPYAGRTLRLFGVLIGLLIAVVVIVVGGLVLIVVNSIGGSGFQMARYAPVRRVVF